MKAPLISIIMALYNAERFVEEAVRSVLNQTYETWELIIINDGSTDSSMVRVRAFQDPRIIILSQTNKGVSAARNAGLNKMRGDFFCFLDADDVFPANSLESRLRVFMEGGPFLEFVDGVVEERDIMLNNVLRRYKPNFRGNPFNEMLKISESCYLGQTWMIRRKHNKMYKMTEGLTHGEDFLFLLENSREGGGYSYTNETILLYRRHSQSAMNNLDGLNNAYLYTCKQLRSWPEVSFYQLFWFWLKSRKIMFLSYLFDGREFFKAVRSLLQWV